MVRARGILLHRMFKERGGKEDDVLVVANHLDNEIWKQPLCLCNGEVVYNVRYSYFSFNYFYIMLGNLGFQA